MLQRQGSPEAERLPGPCPADLRFSGGTGQACTRRAFPCLLQVRALPARAWPMLPGRSSSSGRPEPRTCCCHLRRARSKRKALPPHPRDQSSLGKGTMCSGLGAACSPPSARGLLSCGGEGLCARGGPAQPPSRNYLALCMRCLGSVCCCCCWGGCRFGFLGSMSLDFDGKKLAFHESLSLII